MDDVGHVDKVEEMRIVSDLEHCLSSMQNPHEARYYLALPGAEIDTGLG